MADTLTPGAIDVQFVARAGGLSDVHTRDVLLEPAELRTLLGQIHDTTLLPNRVRYLADMAQQPQLGEMGQALILLTLADARHFSDILRALGHAFADDFIRAGAAAFTACLPPGSCIYHVSVLSFAVLVDTIDLSETMPSSLIQSIVERFRQPLYCDDLPITTRAGVGVVALAATVPAASPAESLRFALAAAQQSREQTKGWATYNRRNDEAHQRSFRMLSELRRALLVNDELSMVYQPRIDLQTGRTDSAEALVRWTHPSWGVISPGEFIPLAEATALMGPLTDYILNQVLRNMATWPSSWAKIRVSVNISPSSLYDLHFVDRLEGLLHAAGVAAERIELEFTEGMLTSTEAIVLAQIERIRALGISIAIDDFGTGYSNLDYLVRLDAQILKIDQSFIRSLHLEPRRRLLVRSIIDLAHALGFVVVAEGIETAEISTMLKEWKCDQGQGYFLSRPLSEMNFMEWMHAEMREDPLLLNGNGRSTPIATAR